MKPFDAVSLVGSFQGGCGESIFAIKIENYEESMVVIQFCVRGTNTMGFWNVVPRQQLPHDCRSAGAFKADAISRQGGI